MNVLVFIHSMSSGGAERVTANLANRWADSGHKVTVVTQSASSADFYQLHASVERVAMESAKESAGLCSALVNNFARSLMLRRLSAGPSQTL